MRTGFETRAGVRHVRVAGRVGVRCHRINEAGIMNVREWDLRDACDSADPWHVVVISNCPAYVTEYPEEHA